jgi:TetR/AcrR family transcriptional regulator, transcriptional repressor for nem operon
MGVGMTRPRQFDENAVLDAAIDCFWVHGYQSTSIRDLSAKTGVSGASLYNAFRNKRSLFLKALDRYMAFTLSERIVRCRQLPPRKAIETFLSEIIDRSLSDLQRKGCLLVNSALDVAPHDRRTREAVSGFLSRIEAFFLEQIDAGQADGSISPSANKEDAARHLLGVVVGMRVLSRVRPEPELLNGLVSSALVVLGGPGAMETKGERTVLSSEAG